MVAAYVVVIGRLARTHSASVRPHRDGVRGSARSGGWLFLRTLTLRAALLATVLRRDRLSAPRSSPGGRSRSRSSRPPPSRSTRSRSPAQALIGKGLGAGDTGEVQRTLGRTVSWGAWFGVIVGAVIGALSGVIGLLFTGDARIAALIQPALIVLAVAQPVCGVVFVLDGVLIGAGDAKYLAIAGVLNLVPFVPALIVLAVLGRGRRGRARVARGRLLRGLHARRGSRPSAGASAAPPG
jgi:hypothetical protein